MNTSKWLLFYYSITSAKPKERVGIWRKVQGMGAVQLKTSLYILPCREALAERLMWLSGEVEAAGGEAAFFRCDGVDNIADDDIVALFVRQSEKAFGEISLACQELDRALGGDIEVAEEKKVKSELRRLRKRFEVACELDYFPGESSASARIALESISRRLLEPMGGASISSLSIGDFVGCTWVTRENLYIDRISSAWLIQRFIDPKAKFRFIASDDFADAEAGEIGFDMSDAQFTHQGELITFEVLMRSFGLTDIPFQRLGELVHYIDVEDGTALPDDAILLKQLVDGLVSLHQDDVELVGKSMVVFDALYAAFKNSA